LVKPHDVLFGVAVLCPVPESYRRPGISSSRAPGATPPWAPGRRRRPRKRRASPPQGAC